MDLTELVNLPVLLFIAHRVFILSTKFPILEQILKEHDKRIGKLEDDK